jgi:hypothetical protein
MRTPATSKGTLAMQIIPATPAIPLFFYIYLQVADNQWNGSIRRRASPFRLRQNYSALDGGTGGIGPSSRSMPFYSSA